MSTVAPPPPSPPSPCVVLPAKSSDARPLWTLWTLWTRYGVDLVWLSVYVAANAVVFWLRYRQYPSDACVGLAPAMAKGSAEAILLNVVLTLLSVCHRVLDRLRRWAVWRPAPSTMANFALQRPMEMHRAFHVLTGSAVVVLSLVHSLAWGAIVVRARACGDAQWRGSRLALRKTHELRDLGSVGRLLLKLPMWTGLVMLLCALLLLPFCVASVRRRYFYVFAKVHSVVLVPLVALLLCHGAAQWSSRFQAPLWLLPAMIVYAIERRSRLSASTASTIVSFGMHCHSPGDTSTSGQATTTMSLYLAKTPRFQRCFEPGMFVYLQVPVVSALEWHPFSVASCQDDALIELRVRVVGDWTRALVSHLSSLSASSSSLHGLALLPSATAARLDGPFGTPSIQYQRYERVALIALGIGVSPFLSVLRHELYTWRRRLKLHRTGLTTYASRPREITLVWVVREPHCVQWLVELLHEFEDVLPAAHHALDLHVYVTSRCDRESHGVAAMDPSVLELHCDAARPQWETLVAAWTAHGWRPQAVFVSGSRAATSAIKSAVACPMAHAPRIDVFAEMFH